MNVTDLTAIVQHGGSCESIFQRNDIPEDLLSKRLVTFDYFEGNPDLSKNTVVDSIMKQLCKTLENSVIIKPLGRDVGCKFLLAKLRSPWKLSGSMDMVDLGHGFFRFALGKSTPIYRNGK